MARPLSPGRSLLRLVEQAALPVYGLNAERRIVFANAALGQWLGQDAETLIGLRCDYHAGASDKPSSDVGAALCPPPEAFQGACDSGAVARMKSDKHAWEQRPARFLWLPGAESGSGLLLVTVLPAGAAPDRGALAGQPSSQQLHELLQRLRGQFGRRFHISQLIGESGAMRRVREQVRVAIDSRTRVLIVGPRGSGREHVASTIHYGQRSESTGPLVPIACPLVDAEEMQAILTGMLKRQVETPTDRPPAALLLDVDRLPPVAQQELAGFLLLPGIELHTLATSRVALQRLVVKGKFRQDLAYALSTLTVSLPPLKNRAEDIPLLAQHFLEKTNAANARQLSGFAPAAMELLTAYGWPGNVEELEGAVLHAIQQATGFTVQAGDLPDAVHLGVHAAAYRPREEETIQLDAFLAEIEKELLERALRRAKGNKSRAAQLLGMNRQRLMRRLVQLGLAPPAAEDEPVVFEPLPEDR